MTFFAGDTVAAADLNGDADVPLCHLVQTTAQTGLTASTDTAVTFGTGSTVVDSLAIHSESSNTSRLVIGGKLGWWEVKGTVATANSNTITYARATLFKNGSGITGSFGAQTLGVSTFMGTHTATVEVQATSAADYVELRTFLTGTGLNLAVNSYVASSIVARWVRDS